MIRAEKLLKLFGFLKRIFKMSRREIMEHQTLNAIAFKEYMGRYKKEGFIERQKELDCFHYGRQNRFLSELFFDGERLDGSKNLCEVIALYNALLPLKHPFQENLFPRLIARFERRGILLNGYLGTDIKEICHFLKKHGYSYRLLMDKTLNREGINLLEEKYETFIMCSFCDRNSVLSQLHTVAITRLDGMSGGFLVHNDGTIGPKPWYPSLMMAVDGFCNGNSNTEFLIGIR